MSLAPVRFSALRDFARHWAAGLPYYSHSIVSYSIV